MSLNNRVIAGLGAVVVIGGLTVGLSVASAAGQPSPVDGLATLTVGSSSIHSEPFPSCYNGGKPLDDAAQTKCQADAKTAQSNGKLPKTDVRIGDQVGVGVAPSVADHGWFAFTDGGQQGQVSLASPRQGDTFSGLMPAANVLNQSGKTTTTVVEADTKTGDILAVWYFEMDTKGA